MYDRILIPLDGSEQAEAALAFAERLPARQACLLRVEPNFQQLAPGPLSDFRPDWREVRAEQVRGELAPLGERLRERGSRVDLAVRFGEAADEIIVEAALADLVVMTTHGRGAMGRAIFGSVADRVARHGPTPTLLLRGSPPAAPAVPARIVVPFDGSALAETALQEARKLADALDVPLHLVRVVDLDQILAPIQFELYAPGRGHLVGEAYDQARAAPEREAAGYLAQLAGRSRAGGVAVETEVRTGTPAFVLLELVGPEDVVAMTTHGRGGVRRWLLGSVAEKLVREAAGPVLLVRPGVAADGASLGGDEASNA